MIDQQAFLSRLKDAGLLAPAANMQQQVYSPWYIKLMQAVCGWMAALFTLAFFGLAIADLFDSPFALFILGSLLVTGSYFLIGTSRSEFTEHLGLAFSLAGQATIAVGLFTSDNYSEAFNWAVLLIIQVALSYIMHSFVHRLISAYLAAGCLALLLNTLSITSFYSGLLLLIVGFIWQYEFALGSSVRKLQATGYGLTLGLIQLKTLVLFGPHGGTWSTTNIPAVNPYLDETLNVLVLLYLIFLMIKKGSLRIPQSLQLFSLTLLVLLCAMTFFANGIAVGIAILLMGYVASNRILYALGVVSALLNLSSYYYLIDISLLDKSIILLVMGGGMLGLAMAMKKMNKSGVATNE